MVRKNFRHEEGSPSIASQPRRSVHAEASGRQPAVSQDLHAVQALLEKMRHIQGIVIRRNSFLTIVCALGTLVVTLHVLFGHVKNWLFAGLFIVYGLLLLIGLRLLNGASHRRFEIAHQLAEHRDLNAIGPLVDGLAYVGSMHDAAVGNLIHLLPYMQSSDADLLSADQRTILCKILAGRSRDPNMIELKIAIMHVFTQIGYTQALPIVERLANRDAAERSRAAAQDCLQVLQALKAQEQANETLLRASATTDSTAETLLRSSHETQQTDPQELLRVTTRNDEG